MEYHTHHQPMTVFILLHIAATLASIQKLEEGIGASMENEDEDATSLNTLTNVSQELNSDRCLENQDNEVINTNKEDEQLKTEDKINSFSGHCIAEGDKAINTYTDKGDKQPKTEEKINNFGEHCIRDGGTTVSHSNGHSVETRISEGSHILLPGNHHNNEQTVSRTQGIGYYN